MINQTLGIQKNFIVKFEEKIYKLEVVYTEVEALKIYKKYYIICITYVLYGAEFTKGKYNILLII